ncbi:MAG: sigma factor-like helix-turn-helix DNA-binding protein [Verrucomicrobiales bacterium]|nr:sigma factor-like helix-turn-helix DNA-binding protein [Verrucomicrobiales bacterium]
MIARAFQTAFNQVRYFRQKNARESQRLQFSDELIGSLSGKAEDFREHTDDDLAALERCLQKLPEKQKRIVALRVEPGGTNRAISKRIGKSGAVVSQTMNKIHESLM